MSQIADEIKQIIQNINNLTSDKKVSGEKIVFCLSEATKLLKNIENKIDKTTAGGKIAFQKIETISKSILDVKDKAEKIKDDTEEMIQILSTIALFIVPALHILSFMIC